MATIHFASSLQRHVPFPPREVEAGTVREALEAAFAARPELRGYVLDDQGALRKHVNVFVAGRQVEDRQSLSDVVPPGAEIHVIQALSGG